MEEPAQVFKGEKTVIKALVVGDVATGKTFFCKHFTHLDLPFKEQYKQSIGVDFISKNFLLCDEEIVSLQMWDIAGTEKFGNMLRVYFKDVLIFFIVISADISEITKFKQIEDWIKNIQDYKKQDCKIILIETKADLETATPLTAQQIAKFVKKDKSVEQKGELSCDAYMLISSKNKTNFPELEQLLIKMFYEVEPNLRRANVVEPILQPKPPLIVEDDVTRAINNLEDNQAEQLLAFVENCVRRGTGTYEKPYELRWFSGTPYKYKSVMQPDVSEPEVELMLPKHIPVLLEMVKLKATSTAKAVLCQIYSKSLDIAKSNSFVRNSSTQYFYQHLLPNYYKKSLQATTLKIYNDINALSEDQASNILKHIRIRLLEGALRNDKPYKLGFFGGVSYKIQDETIKIPEHVSTMLTYLDADPAEMKLTARQSLLYAYEFTMFAALVPKSSRDITTQQFYETDLPEFIQQKVAAFVPPVNAGTQVSNARLAQ